MATKEERLAKLGTIIVLKHFCDLCNSEEPSEDKHEALERIRLALFDLETAFYNGEDRTIIVKGAAKVAANSIRFIVEGFLSR